MEDKIREIAIVDFDLSLSEMRIINMSRIRQVERSMQVHGQLQPVVARVHDAGLQLIDGFKRVYACETLLIDSLQCRLLKVDENQAKVLMLSYNWSTRSMEAYEEALVLQDLMTGEGMNQRDLAHQTGRSRSWVSRRLSLVDRLDEQIGHQIRMGSLSSSHGRALLRLPRGNQFSVSEVISKYNLSSRQAEKLVTAFLEAEDKQAQERVLASVERILFKPQLEEIEVHYPILSEYGNRLLNGLHKVVAPMQELIKVLDQEKPEIPTEEEAIVAYSIEILSDGFSEIKYRLEELQNLKTHTENER